MIGVGKICWIEPVAWNSSTDVSSRENTSAPVQHQQFGHGYRGLVGRGTNSTEVDRRRQHAQP